MLLILGDVYLQHLDQELRTLSTKRHKKTQSREKTNRMKAEPGQANQSPRTAVWTCPAVPQADEAAY